VRDDGSLLGERTVSGEHRCEELAEAAAVMIAAWLDAAPPPGLKAPRLAPRPEVAIATGPAPPAPRSWDVGAGLGASLSEAGRSPALHVGGGVDLVPRVLGLRLGGSFTGWAEVPLGDRAARWRRSAVALGVRTGAADPWLAGELHAGATAAWLQVEGSGFDAVDSRSEGDLVWGVQGGGRLSLARGRWRPFLDGSVSFWPAHSRVYALPQGTASQLPRVQVLLTLGIALAR
jgi:hypothetical protein